MQLPMLLMSLAGAVAIGLSAAAVLGESTKQKRVIVAIVSVPLLAAVIGFSCGALWQRWSDHPQTHETAKPEETTPAPPAIGYGYPR